MLSTSDRATRVRGLAVVVLALGLLSAGCATQSGEESLVTTIPQAPTTTTALVEQAEATTTTTVVPTTTSTTAPLPRGVSYEGPGPRAGDLVAVVGVAHDDVLNVREGPGVGFDITDTLEPTALDVPVTGEARLLPTSIWYEVETSNGTGWVNSSFIGLLGATDEATVLVTTMLGSPLAADDFSYLGATIADAFLGDEGNRWIALVEPSEGGVSPAVPSLTIDAIGLSDDSVKGYRFVVHATHETSDGPFQMRSVERTAICWRGVTPGGLCL